MEPPGNPRSSNQTAPLYVDLDGTLAASDLLTESILALLKQRPLAIFDLLRWMTLGKATLNARIAAEVDLDVTRLPYDRRILALIGQARAQGRKVVLATSNHPKYADAVAAHLGLFDDVVASDQAGNHSAPVQFEAGRRRSRGPSGDPEQGAARSSTMSLLSAMRLHQWVKNILLLMPALPLATQLDASDGWDLLLAFVCFGFCASSVYLLNDLLDIDADRQHATKSRRAIASGELPLALAVACVPALLLIAFALAWWALPWAFGVVLALYWVLTVAYSVRLKRVTVVDVLLLAGLYTMRILAGAAVIGVMPSFWILAFSMFMFFSLASAKRYIELTEVQRREKLSTAGRGYNVGDIPVVLVQGVAAGQIAVLVFALYIQDPVATQHFSLPHCLWGVAPLLLYWVSRLWMKALRAKVHDDPLVFALKDRQSQFIGLACIGLVWGAM